MVIIWEYELCPYLHERKRDFAVYFKLLGCCFDIAVDDGRLEVRSDLVFPSLFIPI